MEQLGGARRIAVIDRVLRISPGASPLTKIASGSPGTVNSFTITGLDTINNDYKISVRLKRPIGGVASDYLTIQFGDTSATPVWFTDSVFISASGVSANNLTSTAGITRIAQVQNSPALYMGTEIALQFSADGLVVSGLAHSYFWENYLQFDAGPKPSVIGALRFTTPNQSWETSYSAYALEK